MNLSMTASNAAAYKSGSQRAGKVTEAWGAENFYCPNCSSPKLDWLKAGTQASDYQCPNCGFWYQLKSQKSPIGKSIRDGAYQAMMAAINEDRAPSYFFLHYDLETWSVRNLILVPHFAFPPSAIIKCPPLSPAARRAGWVGCNFALNRIPADARIPVVTEKQIKSPAEVRAQFQKVKPFQELSVKQRGWTLDVLNVVRNIVSEGRAPRDPNFSERSGTRGTRPSDTFTTAEVYAFASELEKLHPDNRHVKDKIRQQLQVLRDMGLLIHISTGRWRLP